MSERHVQRLIVVITAVVAALVVLFWPIMHKIVYPHEPMGSVLNLRPGIDMVGGTSLVYAIKQPPGGWHGPEPLAIAEMTAIKRRVDPDGLKNLHWIPQESTNRLEIQLPMTPERRAVTAQRDLLEQQLATAQAALDATNIRPQEVIDAVEQVNGKTRADLPKFVLGSPQRIALFARLCTVWDAIGAAQKHQNADEQAKQSLLWDDLTKTQPGHRSGIEDTNLAVADLESALSSGPTSPALASINARSIGWPERLAAIDQYAKVYDGLSKLKGTIDTSNDLKRELQGAGVLEFHILVDYSEIAPADLQKLRERLETFGPRVEAGDTMRWYEIEAGRLKSARGNIIIPYNGKDYVLGWITKEKSLDNRPGTPAWRLTEARRDNDPTGATVVGFKFDPEGGKLFGDITGGNIQKPMAIMLDNKVISVANIQKQITDSGIIDGGRDGYTPEELDYMIDTLTAGSLPAELSEQPISEQTVGPQLGQDNLHRGLLACVLGLVVVAVFLISYYYIGGMVATFAVLLNVTIILAVMAGFQATFTLPSVAGIVLTIGTAVDAHVLIFERLREEQHRGLSLRMALRNAHGKALSAIVDSNMTTVITSIFLIWFGTEEVKGFGITLIIGIVASLFTALFVTRTLLEILIEDCGLRNLNSFPLTFPKWDKFLRPSIDWMKLAPYFITFSILGVGSGLALFYHYAKAGEVLNIEFTSGTSVQFALKTPMPIGDVRGLLNNADPAKLPSFSIVSIGEGNLTYEVATPNPNAVQVRDAVIKSLVVSGQSVLNAEVPSSFDGAGKQLTDVQNTVVIPITDAALASPSDWPGTFRPKGVSDFNPGVAIYLNHLDPPLTVTQIKQRITDEQQSESGGVSAGAGASSQDFVVVGANGASTGGGPAGTAQSGNIDQPINSAVILASQTGLDYSKDVTNWQTQLAEPMWKLVNYGVNRPAQLQQVKNFDAAVAGDTKDNAILALTLSIIVIMVYIWVRFGNLKYGTATVIALIHDTLFTIAALGFAHYIFNFPELARLLQIDPFRIDLTIVAGILTIMGYSMIDTIVVFDRIRENRGKFGHVNRQVINDAINQTLSRTLLTAGTTTITVAIMYFVGGPGIHGFTFVLLIGILVGTYSSIAIAAPFLLIGGGGGKDNAGAKPKTYGFPVKPLQKAGA